MEAQVVKTAKSQTMKRLWCWIVGHLRAKWAVDGSWLDFKGHPFPSWVTQESRSAYCLRCGKDLS